MTEKKGDGILLLFDLNGTLIHRTEPGEHAPEGTLVNTDMKIIRKKRCCKKDPAKGCSHIDPRDGHIMQMSDGKFTRFVRVRPGIVTLFDRLLDYPMKITIGFYSSMMYKNVLPILNFVKYVHGEEWPKTYILDRTFNKKDPKAENSWDTMRDPEVVWKFFSDNNLHFNATSTIFVDNELRKIREYPDSAIIIDSWDGKSDDKVLEQLIKDLYYRFALFTEHNDVRINEKKREKEMEDFIKDIDKTLEEMKKKEETKNEKRQLIDKDGKNMEYHINKLKEIAKGDAKLLLRMITMLSS